jgi:hypothetical protein
MTMNANDKQIQFAIDSVDKALKANDARNVRKGGGFFHFIPEEKPGLSFIVEIQSNGRLSVEADLNKIPAIAKAIDENSFFVTIPAKGEGVAGYGYEVRWVDVVRDASGTMVPRPENFNTYRK